MKIENHNEDFTFLCLNSKKVKVLVVGGGTAALVKVKSLLKKGFLLECISPEFKEEFCDINSKNLKLINGEFQDGFIEHYHVIVICTNNEILNQQIRELCDKKCKIYIDSTMPEESVATLCAMESTREVAIGVRLKGKSPKTSQLLVRKIKEYVTTYDDYLSFVTKLRGNIKHNPNRLEILEFVSSEDFLFFFQRSYGEEIFNLFYGGDSIEF